MTAALKDLTLKAARHWVVNLILRIVSKAEEACQKRVLTPHSPPPPPLAPPATPLPSQAPSACTHLEMVVVLQGLTAQLLGDERYGHVQHGCLQRPRVPGAEAGAGAPPVRRRLPPSAAALRPFHCPPCPPSRRPHCPPGSTAAAAGADLGIRLVLGGLTTTTTTTGTTAPGPWSASR